MAAKVGFYREKITVDVDSNAALLTIMVAALPAGALGLFLAGVIATEMSTLDSYCLLLGQYFI
ncbi:MAG: hypothetical protein CM1200mP1_12680 [Candidatus Neomarinimicrobiota bacterium]|nr:MAG: hypothetical protein CM1200mP1_12680 [Candidatus Neomarinimicrobiota bacterium]